MAELSPPDFNLATLATNLVILVGFIAAIIAGLWKGYKEIKKTPVLPSANPDSITGSTAIEFVRASMEDAQTIRDLTRANANLETRVRDLDRGVEDMAEELRSNRLAIQRTGETIERLIRAIEHNTEAIQKAWQ